MAEPRAQSWVNVGAQMAAEPSALSTERRVTEAESIRT